MKSQFAILASVVSLATILLSFTDKIVFETAPTSPNNATIAVCAAMPNSMAELAAKPEFQKLHQPPAPVSYHGIGEMVTFSTPDGATAKGFFIKAARPSKKWLLVYQEWWGLNDNIKEEARQLYDKLGDVNVLAPDMYDGNVTTDPAEAGKWVGSVKPERLTSIIQGGIAYTGKESRLASIGWCFGGGLSVQSAILAGSKAKGCVLYYGFPEKDVNKLKMLQTDVLAIFGSQDTMISADIIKQFETNMASADKKVQVKTFDAGHAFANPSNLINTYNKPFADEANALALSYLKSRLK